MDVKRVVLRFASVLGLVVGMGIVATLLLSPPSLSHAEPRSPPPDRPRLLADTFVSSDVTANTTWNVAGSPYVISDTAVTVQTGVALTIEPGVTVYFSGTAAGLEVAWGARLVAMGTPSQPITFTSYELSSPAAGDWTGILLHNDALTSTLQHVLIEYGDYGLRIGSSDAAHSVLSSTIRHTAAEGIGGGPDYALIAYNSIYGCGGAGISMVGSGLAIPGMSNVISGNLIHSNSAEGIHAEFQDQLTIQGNHVYANAMVAGWAAIHVSDSQNGLAIRENWVHDNGSGTNAIYVAALYLIPWEPSERSVQVTDNVIREERGDGVRYTAKSTGSASAADPYLLGNAICVPTSLGVPFGLAKYSGVNDAPATGNWWGTNTPLLAWNIWGTVDFDPWIVFGLADAGTPPYPADGVTPVTLTVSLNDGSGNTVYGVARTITVETSGGSFAGGGTVVTVTLDDNGEADVALIPPADTGSVAVTVTDYCGAAIVLPLRLVGTDLAIAKAGGGYAALPGGVVTYTLAYANASDIAARAVWITDTLPGSASYISDSSGLTVSTSITQVWWEVGDLPPHTGSEFVLTLTAALEDCGTTITNTASVASAVYDERPEDNVDVSLPVAVVCVDLAVTKTVAVSDAAPGEALTYTIRVSNVNPYSATGVYVTETVPVYTAFEGGGCLSPPTCVGNPWTLDSGGVYSIAVGELGPYGEAVVEFVVRITDTLQVSVTVPNQACVWSEYPDLNPGDNCASQQMAVSPRPMEVSKDDGVSCAFPGDLIPYTIAYANPRTTENEIVLTEHLPEYTTYVGGSEWAYAGGNVYTRSLGLVAGGAAGSVVFVVRIDDPLSDTVQAITNVVEISDGEPFTLSTPLPLQPDLTVVKNDNLGMASLAYVELYEALSGRTYVQRASSALGAEYIGPGQVISYSISYLNVGRTTAHNVVLTETLPLYTSYVGFGWTDIGDGRHFTWSVGTLDPGMGDQLEFYVRVSDSVPSGIEWIHNLVEIGGDEEECSSGNNVSSEETPLTGTVSVAGFHLYLPIVLSGDPIELEPPRVDIEVGPHPKSLVISERLNRVYVTLWDDDGSGNTGGDGRLAVLDLATRAVITKVLTGGVHPGGIAMLRGRLYVANRDSNNVAVIDPTSLAVLKTINVGRQPFGVAAAGDRVYVTNFEDGTLSIIDAPSGAVIWTVWVGAHPSMPAAWNDCAYVPNHSGGESVTVVCADGAEVHRLRDEWGHFAAAVDSVHEFAYISRRDGVPGLYEISLHPPYDGSKPVRKKSMWGKRPFAIAYNPTTNHILVVAAANDELHIIWPGGYNTGNVWTLLPQNEGAEWHGGQGIDTSGHDVWVTNYADGSVSILFDPM